MQGLGVLMPSGEVWLVLGTFNANRSENATRMVQVTLGTDGGLALPEAVEPLLRAVRDPDPRVRRSAADALEHFEGAASTIVPVLTGAIAAEPSAPVRVEMGWTLKKLKADPQAWAPAFRSSLGDTAGSQTR